MMESASASLHASPQWRYLAASAVVPTFEPVGLSGLGTSEPDFASVLDMMVDAAEPVLAGPAKGQWKLREDVRRRVLATLATRENVRETVEATAGPHPDHPTTRAVLELVTQQGPPPLAGRSLEELLAMDQAVEWLSATAVQPLPSRADLHARIQREKLLEPLRRLVAGFQGRDEDLKALRIYVDSLPSRSPLEGVTRSVQRLGYLFRNHPPFVIFGPGGTGKSTLVAKFILDHTDVDKRGPMAFVLLDFDRRTLDPASPDALLKDIVSQLSLQFPEHSPDLAELAGLLEENAVQTEDSIQFRQSDYYDRSEVARARVCRVMNAISKSSGQNLLFVVDTFEIVQRRGSSAVYSLLDFVGRLLSEVKRLRVVLVGRAELHRDQFPFAEDVIKWQPWPLKGFDQHAGRAYLRAQLKRYKLPSVSDADLDRLVFQVRGNPLGLRLAAQVFAREGVSGVEDAIGRQRLNESIAEEQLQGILHARIIDELENKELQKIANPGLLVRRITADVIREVLARPCRIDLKKSSPEFLFTLLRNEISLVEPLDAHTLRHRPDVREIMLSSLRREQGSRAKEVDDLAVRFWEQRSGPEERAEEIYHRLWRNDSQEELDARWIPDAGQFLEDAWDEFQTVEVGDWARIWLSERLGRELPDDIRQRADQVVWERDIERKVRVLLADNNLPEALRVLQERPHTTWLPASPLWLLEIEARLLHNDAAGALEVSSVALERVTETTNGAHTLLLLVRRAVVLEHLGRLEDAAATASEAMTLAGSSGNREALFSCGIIRSRLARSLGRAEEPESMALRAELSKLSTHPTVQRALTESPVLLREAITELGAEAPALIVSLLEQFAHQQGPPSSIQNRLYAELLRALGAASEETSAAVDQRAAVSHFADQIREGQVEQKVLGDFANLYPVVWSRITNFL